MKLHGPDHESFIALFPQERLAQLMRGCAALRTLLVLATLVAMSACASSSPSAPGSEPHAGEGHAVPSAQAESLRRRVVIPADRVVSPPEEALRRASEIREREAEEALTFFDESLDFRACMAAAPELPGGVGRATAIELVRLGLPRLDDARLRRWNEIRVAISRLARNACALVWVDELESDDALALLASLDETMVRDFYRIRLEAIRSTPAAPAPPVRDAATLRRGIDAVIGRLVPSDAQRLESTIDRATGREKNILAIDDACFLELALMETAQSLPPAEEAALLRAITREAAAQPSLLPPECLRSRAVP